MNVISIIRITVYICIVSPISENYGLPGRQTYAVQANIDYGHNPGDGGHISLSVSQWPSNNYTKDCEYHISWKGQSPELYLPISYILRIFVIGCFII